MWEQEKPLSGCCSIHAWKSMVFMEVVRSHQNLDVFLIERMNNYTCGMREQCLNLKQLEDMMLSLTEKAMLGADLHLGLLSVYCILSQLLS